MAESMNIYLYPNTVNDQDLIDPAREALETATKKTINHFLENEERIGRRIEVIRDYPDIELDVDKSLFETLGEFSQHLKKKEGERETGEHLLITRGGGGLAVAAFGGAWQNSPVSIATIRPKEGLQYFKSLCIHETYHNFITNGRLGLEPDHKLGYVKPKTGKQTPMINGYLGKGPDTAGNCSNTASSAPYSLELSSCTLDATLESYREQGNIF